MEQFFKDFDPNGWSIWEMKYQKAEGEGTVMFKTSNLLKGFLVRCDRMRKDSFGVLGIYGSEPDLNISGVWFWRGLDIYPDLLEHPSFQWYERRKLDVNNEADRNIICEYWMKTDEEELVLGSRLADCVIWK